MIFGFGLGVVLRLVGGGDGLLFFFPSIFDLGCCFWFQKLPTMVDNDSVFTNAPESHDKDEDDARQVTKITVSLDLSFSLSQPKSEKLADTAEMVKREREREKESVREKEKERKRGSMCERERERGREEKSRGKIGNGQRRKKAARKRKNHPRTRTTARATKKKK